MYIRQKLFISLLAVVIIPILFLSYLFYLDTRKSLENEEFKKLNSIGIVTCTPTEICSTDELLTRADKLMYEKKREKLDST